MFHMLLLCRTIKLLSVSKYNSLLYLELLYFFLFLHIPLEGKSSSFHSHYFSLPPSHFLLSLFCTLSNPISLSYFPLCILQSRYPYLSLFLQKSHPPTLSSLPLSLFYLSKSISSSSIQKFPSRQSHYGLSQQKSRLYHVKKQRKLYVTDVRWQGVPFSQASH